MTQEAFAEKTDLSRRYLQLIEGGKVNPTIQIALQIKEACKCEWTDLLG